MKCIVFLFLAVSVVWVTGLFVHVEDVYEIQLSSAANPGTQLYYRTDASTDSRLNFAMGIPFKMNLVFDLRAAPPGTYRVLPLMKIYGMTPSTDSQSSIALYSNTTTHTVFPPTSYTPAHKTWTNLSSSPYFSGTGRAGVQQYFSLYPYSPNTNGFSAVELSPDCSLITLDASSTKFITLYINQVGSVGGQYFANTDLYGIVLTLDT